MVITKWALLAICSVCAILGCLVVISFVLHYPLLRDIIAVWLGIVLAFSKGRK